MKTLAELRTEVELGIAVYPSNRDTYYIQRASDGAFVFWYEEYNGRYHSFEALLDDMIDADLPIWSTNKRLHSVFRAW